MEYGSRIDALTAQNPFISKTDVVYTLLLEDVMQGRRQGGAKLFQEELSTQFGISRSPVREALNRLVDDGYLERSAAGGYSVYLLRLEDYIALNDFRAMLEIFGARLAVKHITDTEMKLLSQNIAETEKAVAAKDLDAFSRLDKEFHATVVLAGKNQHLSDTYRAYSQRFHLFRVLTVSEDILNIAIKWHKKIYQAILDGDVDGAAEATRMHRETTINSAVTVCRERHDWHK